MIAQIFTVQSAAPDASKIRSSRVVAVCWDIAEELEEADVDVVGLPELDVEVDAEDSCPRTDDTVPGSKHTDQMASECPSRVALGSTRPRSHTRIVASCPPENIQPSPSARPPVEKDGDAGHEARHVTTPSWPRCVK